MITLGSVVALLAVFSACLLVVTRWFSSRIGEGLILNLRAEVFTHVLTNPSPSSPALRREPLSTASTPT